MNDMITWSVNVKYRKFVKIRSIVYFPMHYVVWLFFATLIAVGVSYGSTWSVLQVVLLAVVYLLLLICIGVLLGPFFTIRKIKRLTNTLVQHYELTKNQLTLVIGKDRLTLPRDQLKITKMGKDFIILKRNGALFGSFGLMFDSPEDLAMARKELGLGK